MSLEILLMHIVGNEVVDAIAATARGFSTGLRQAILNLEDAGHVANTVVADDDIGDLTLRAPVILILWAEHDRKAGLAEASPGILQQVAFEQYALRILQLKIVFYDVRIAGGSRLISGLSFFPRHGFEKMVATDFDIRRIDGRAAAAEEYIFPRRFDVVIKDLERAGGVARIEVAVLAGRLGV